MELLPVTSRYTDCVTATFMMGLAINEFERVWEGAVVTEFQALEGTLSPGVAVFEGILLYRGVPSLFPGNL
jgi:hypothetical protein